MTTLLAVIEYWVSEANVFSTRYVEMIEKALKEGFGFPVTECLAVIAFVPTKNGDCVLQYTFLWQVDAKASTISGNVIYDIEGREALLDGLSIYRTDIAYHEDDVHDMKSSMVRAKGDFSGTLSIEEFRRGKRGGCSMERNILYDVRGSGNEKLLPQFMDLKCFVEAKHGEVREKTDQLMVSEYDSDIGSVSSGGSEASEASKGLSVICEDDNCGDQAEGSDDDDDIL
jgi:hypothetical protein